MHLPYSLEEEWVEFLLSHNDGGRDEVLGVSDDECVFAMVGHVVVQMVDDGRTFLIKLYATFAGQLSNRLTWRKT